MVTHDPLRTALEIREQLSSEKRRLGFFLGAGTSMAVGLPGIVELTKSVADRLPQSEKVLFSNIKNKLPEGSNVENVLDKIRIYSELVGTNQKEEYAGLKDGSTARELDKDICNAIRDIVSEVPQKELKPHSIFAQWLRALHSSREWPVEIFTTNYDLLLEKAMEDYGVPFFDGFIGSVSPFFIPESVEAELMRPEVSVYPPKAWTRLWKLHGSINWFSQKKKGEEIIIRLSGVKSKEGEELIIFPSREKYTQSRKLPFITFQDRFRKYLCNGECHLIVAGYSFSDQHLNQIIFQGLRSNPRLSITALMFGENKHDSQKEKRLLQEQFVSYGMEYRNMTVYGPDKACIGGIVAPWGEPGRKPRGSEVWPFWNEENKQFGLGDFNLFTSFLELFIGFRQTTADIKEETNPLTQTKEISQEPPQS